MMSVLLIFIYRNAPNCAGGVDTLGHQLDINCMLCLTVLNVERQHLFVGLATLNFVILNTNPMRDIQQYGFSSLLAIIIGNSAQLRMKTRITLGNKAER
jgi:hypothetical protein